MFKSVKALVLREVKYRESDKILTVLTEEGKLTVSARGALSKSGRLSASCQFFCFSDMTIYDKGGKWYVKEAQPIEQFLGLRRDISVLALATYFAELLEAVSDEDSPQPQILRLGLNSLFVLSEDLYSQEHIKATFELRLMCLAGYEPCLDCCGICGEEKTEGAAFGIYSGVLVCEGCVGQEPCNMERKKIDGACLSAMRYIIFAEPKKLFSFSLEGESEKSLYHICEEYVTAQLERCFTSLDYWKSVR